MRNYSVFLIVLATCALALGPFCTVFVGPAGYARWMLAHAANEFQREKPAEAEAILQKAILSSREIAADPEYWALRAQLVFDKNQPDAAAIASLSSDAVRFLSELDEGKRYMGSLIVSNLLQENDQYEQAIDVLQTLYPQLEKRSASMNNNIAYFRSLSGKDLPLALREINASLESDSSAGSMDTKAWILHGLGRDSEALKFADKGLEKVYKSLADGTLDAIDQKVVLISDPQEARLFSQMFAPDLNIFPSAAKKEAAAVGKDQPKEVDQPKEIEKPQDEVDLDRILDGLVASPKPDSQKDGPRKNDGKNQIGIPSASVDASDDMKAKLDDGGPDGQSPELASDLLDQLNTDARAAVRLPKLAREPVELIKTRFPNLNPFLIEGLAKTIAVMRYHRACILHDLGRFDEWDRDMSWLELFGFTDTTQLK